MNKATDYKASVYQIKTSDGLSWYAEFPDFPGVAGGGNTAEQALKDAYENLAAMIDFYAENKMPLPKVKNENDEYSGRITLRMSKTLHAKIAKQAEKENISLNSYICEALSSYYTASEGIKIFYEIKNKTKNSYSSTQFVINREDHPEWYSTYQSFENKGFAS